MVDSCHALLTEVPRYNQVGNQVGGRWGGGCSGCSHSSH
jgi:hypothetical protein